MALPWADTTGFHIAPCLPCCVTTSCYLTIPPPIGASPYADLATATSVLADPLQVASCLGFNSGGPPIASFTATLGTGTLIMSVTDSSPFGLLGITLWAGAYVLSGQTITYAASGFPLVSGEIYDDTGTLVDTLAAGSSSTSIGMPSDGCYAMRINLSAFMSPVFSGGVTISSSGTIVFATIRAAYDDGSGGTDYVVCV